MGIPRKKTVIIGLITVAVLILGVLIVGNVTPSATRAALPSSATEINEYYKSAGLTDFVRLLKARLPKGEFDAYLSNLRISKNFFDLDKVAESAAISWAAVSNKPDWWDPSDDLSTSFVDHDGKNEFYTIVKYENGYVYFKAFAW